MKANVRWLTLLVLGAALSSAMAVERGNVRIDFVQPQRFTDFRIQGWDEIGSAPIFANMISNYLAPIVARRFPGATLSLRFTDIRLAGRLEPWRVSGSGFRNSLPLFYGQRFAVNMRYPMRLAFDYSLVDSRGHVLSQGSKSLTEVDYIQRYVIWNYGTRSTLFYEKMVLRDWVDRLQATSVAQGTNLAK
jgi:hypothetical protein